MLEQDRWRTVDSPDEIHAMLETICRSQTLLRVEAPGWPLSMMALIAEVDAASGTLIVEQERAWGNDPGSPGDGRLMDDDASVGGSRRAGGSAPSHAQADHPLIESGNLLFEAILENVQVEFNGSSLARCSYKGRPAFCMPVPQVLRRAQRREFGRIQVPASHPAMCVLPVAALPRGEARLLLRDISPGGVALFDHRHLLDSRWGTVYAPCRLELPEVGWVMVNLRVAHGEDISVPGAEHGAQTGRCVGCAFVDLPDVTLMRIRHYAWLLERILDA